MKKQIIEKPILFKPEMVAAILKNKKTVTRRIIDPQPPDYVCYFISDYWKHSTHKMYKTKESKALYFTGCELSDEPTSFYLKSKYWIDLFLWVKEKWTVAGYNKYFRKENNKIDYEISVLYTSGFINLSVYLDKEQWQRIVDREKQFLKRGLDSNLWRSSLFMPRVASRITLKVKNVRIERLQELDNTEAVLEGCKDRTDYARLWDEINKTHGYTWKDNPWVYRILFEKVLNAGNAG